MRMDARVSSRRDRPGRPALLYPVILAPVKTAISVPDETFEQVERAAQRLGVTRSELYTRAARCYLAYLEQGSLTAEIDAALDLAGEDDSSQVAVAAGKRRLLTDDEW
jgi:hypothetical protein